MKVLIITTNGGSDGWGGSELLWQQTALRLVDRGFEVSALVPNHKFEDPILFPLLTAGVSIQRCRKNLQPKALRSGVARILNLPGKIARRLTKVDVKLDTIANLDADLVVVSQGSLDEGLETLERIASCGTPFVVVNQLVSVHQWPSDGTCRRLQRILTLAKKVFFVSTDNLRNAETQLGKLPNAAVVRNPFLVGYDDHCPFPAVSGDLFTIGAVGRLATFHKGYDLLLQVLAAEKWKSRPLLLKLFGEGPNHQRLLELCSELGLASRVQFCGRSNNIGAVWEQCHAMILPSRMEGLSLALVEAMLSGRMAIATNVGGAAELIRDGENGFLADFPSVASIDNALERAWERRSDWEELGRRAAVDVRSLIPRDPVGVFVDELLELCGRST